MTSEILARKSSKIYKNVPLWKKKRWRDQKEVSKIAATQSIYSKGIMVSLTGRRYAFAASCLAAALSGACAFTSNGKRTLI
jgi:hypothetical protein